MLAGLETEVVMHCESVMRAAVAHMGPGVSSSAVAKKMRDEGVGFLPICDADDVVVGVVTDRDIAMRICAESRLHETPVGEIMSRNVIKCRPSDTIGHVTELMSRHQKSRLVVVDEAGKLRGVISLTDLAHCDEPLRVAVLLRQICSRELRVRPPHDI
jgi:CBS domain-containing protein